MNVLKAILKTLLIAPIVLGALALAVVFIYFAGAIVIIGIALAIIAGVYLLVKDDMEYKARLNTHKED